jgi:hypothetical protein
MDLVRALTRVPSKSPAARDCPGAPGVAPCAESSSVRAGRACGEPARGLVQRWHALAEARQAPGYRDARPLGVGAHWVSSPAIVCSSCCCAARSDAWSVPTVRVGVTTCECSGGTTTGTALAVPGGQVASGVYTSLGADATSRQPRFRRSVRIRQTRDQPAVGSSLRRIRRRTPRSPHKITAHQDIMPANREVASNSPLMPTSAGSLSPRPRVRAFQHPAGPRP